MSVNQLEESRRVAAEMEDFMNQTHNELLDGTDLQLESKWSEAMETLLKNWSERAMGYRWMHEKCRDHHKKADVVFTLPQIILSSLAGSANLGLSSVVPAEQQTNANLVVGIIGIGVGILGAISQYLRHSALSESHRAASISWGRMSRTIATELSLSPDERTNPAIHFLRDQQSAFDQNIENSPPILDHVLEEFRNKFCDVSAKSTFFPISKPEIAAGLAPVIIHGREERKRAKALSDAAGILGGGRKGSETFFGGNTSGSDGDDKGNDRMERRSSISKLRGASWKVAKGKTDEDPQMNIVSKPNDEKI